MSEDVEVQEVYKKFKQENILESKSNFTAKFFYKMWTNNIEQEEL